MIDPYDAPPSFWRRHAALFGALGVFGALVVLTVIAFPPYDVPEFAYAFAAPAIFWAYLRPRFRLYAITVLSAQAVAWTIILGWLHHVTWLGLILLGPVVGIWVGSWFLVVWWVIPRLLGRRALLRILAVFGLAGLWVVIEWTRSWVLSGFPWLSLAASQWQRSSILQIAAFTGAGGISFVLIAMNLGFSAYLFRLLREGKRGLQRRSQEFFAALFLLVVCLSIHVQETFHRGQFQQPLGKVAFVQPYIPQAVKWDPSQSTAIFETLEKTTLQAAAMRPQLILWPEAVTPWALRGDDGVKRWAESLVAKARTPLLLGSIAIEQGGTPEEIWQTGAFVIDPERGVRPGHYVKRKLVPFGEFVPFRPLLGWIGKFVEIGGDFTAGDDPAPLLVNLGDTTVAVGPLICYEDIFPQLSRHSVLAGADVLAVLTNNAWFGEGGAAYQHAAHSVLRAVETRRPVLRCGNGGWSGWIDEFGGIRAVATDTDGSIYFRGTRAVEVSRDARWIGQQSFYVRHGDWFVFVSLLLFGLGVAVVTLGPREEEIPPAAEEKTA